MLENFNDYITFFVILAICLAIIIWFLSNVAIVLFARYKKRVERLRRDDYEIEH